MPRSFVGVPVGVVVRSSVLLACVAGGTLLVGCTSHPLAAITPGPEVEDNQLFPIETTKKIDLLFVVDNSISMKEEQASLRTNFPRFMQALEERGVPDLQIAVISTDLGAGGINVANCSGIGDAGRFQAAANCPLQAGAPPFLKIDAQGQKNFNGALTDAFACIASLGTDGCGYEHQLQSLRVSLSNNNPHLGAFLRPDAHLGIIIISDEDDCSGDFDSTLYVPTTIAGQSQNLRCATAGHVCQDRPVTAMPMSVPLSSCRAAVHGPDEASRRAGLLNIETFVNHVKSLKAPGRRILVAGIYGSGVDGDYEIANNSTAGLDVVPKCEVRGAGTAAPGIRLRAFIDAFGADGSHHSICGADLRDAMTKIGEAVAVLTGDTCLKTRPRDIDPATSALEVECAVYEQETAMPTAQPRLIPQCTASSAARPCWEVANDVACVSSRTRLTINRNGPAPDGFTIVARCSADAGGVDGGR